MPECRSFCAAPSREAHLPLSYNPAPLRQLSRSMSTMIFSFHAFGEANQFSKWMHRYEPMLQKLQRRLWFLGDGSLHTCARRRAGHDRRAGNRSLRRRE